MKFYFFISYFLSTSNIYFFHKLQFLIFNYLKQKKIQKNFLNLLYLLINTMLKMWILVGIGGFFLKD